MIIPQFQLIQSEEQIIIIIRVPYVKIQKSEFYIDEYEFKFYLHPYLLSLKFEQKLEEMEDPAELKYDSDKYLLTVKLNKFSKGEFFKDLDMITKLLNKEKKKQKKGKQPLIQLIEEKIIDENENTESQLQIDKNKNYGFNDEISNFFRDLEAEMYEISQLNPDETIQDQRINLREEIMNNDFNEDNYLFDLFENEDVNYTIQNQINYQYEFTDDERDVLQKIKKYENFDVNIQKIQNQMIDILFSYCYEYRVMDKDINKESAITINKLSSTLSCHCINDNLNDVILTCFKRCLCYPLIRNFELAQQTLKDLVQLVNKGKSAIIKIFINLKLIFDLSEPRYLLNTLYIDNFIWYIQNMDDLDILTQQLNQIKIQKNQIFNLELIEEDAKEMMENDMELEFANQAIN